ncbi:MAG TPA: alkaline phosphatase D family protein [Ramlibacter sp.]|nr:alkaline phosphatase D family protein [Ramlibacter sp.]
MRRREVLAAGAAAAALPLAPARAADAPLRRIGFASCIHQDRPQPLMDHLAAQPFDLFLFGGDNVYCDRPYSRERLRSAYALATAAPGYAALRRAVPHLAVWDDNDYSPGDSGADFALKQQSKDEFLAFWNLPSTDPRRGREGLYHAQVYGPPGQQVQVILLDTRWFRSAIQRERIRLPGDGGYVPDADPAKTMLGQAQWRWLEEQLRQSADVRLLVSSVQVLAEGHRWERWGNLPAERERLLRLIGSTGARGVVLLSGDRHFAALYRQPQGAPYTLTELTASGVTHSWDSPTDQQANRVGAPFTGFNYGTVEIDWAARSLRLAARDGQGSERLGQTLHIDELKART